jgi:hypothetical protein
MEVHIANNLSKKSVPFCRFGYIEEKVDFINAILKSMEKSILER